MTIFASQTNVISALNSALLDGSDALANGESFTGTWENVEQYGDLVVAVATDVAGYYQIQFSPDGVNADSTLTRYHKASGINAPHRFSITRKFCRVVFTNNSGSDQSYLRLQTSFGNRHPLNAPIDGVLARDYDATIVRPTNSEHETALGRRQGQTTWHKFGYNTDVDVSTSPEVLASWGGTFTPRTTGTTLSIVSTDANDADGDTGAHGIVIYGVDANWKTSVEVVLLTGTTPVVTTSSWIGINRIALYRAGSSLVNEGTITVTAVTGGAIMAQMPVGVGTSQQVIFYVPVDTQALIEHINAFVIRFGVGTEPLLTLVVWVFSAVSNAKYNVATFYIDASLSNHFAFDPQLPLQVGEKSAIWIEATTTRDDTSCTGRIVLTTYQDADA